MNILTTHNAWVTCSKQPGHPWTEKHKDTIEKMLLDALPHGSGIDCKWRFWLSEKTIVATNSYHHMHESGMYDVYTDFAVTIKGGVRDMFGHLIFKITGAFPYKYSDTRDYLYEIIGDALHNMPGEPK